MKISINIKIIWLKYFEFHFSFILHCIFYKFIEEVVNEILDINLNNLNKKYDVFGWDIFYLVSLIFKFYLIVIFFKSLILFLYTIFFFS